MADEPSASTNPETTSPPAQPAQPAAPPAAAAAGGDVIGEHAPGGGGPGEGVVEVDTDETDSAFGDDLASETTSITSSILHHQYENGRRYHSYKSGKYIMPNDEEEQDRLDIHHHICLLHLDGELFMAPIGDHPEQIYDMGTGTGIWAIDMADKFPSATVTGVDLSPSQPTWVPPNVRFEVDDVEEEFTFSKPADFIHCRYFAGSIRDWPKFIRQCFGLLKPGGWIEFKDWDVRPYNPAGELTIPDNYVKKWHDLILATCEDWVGATANPALLIPNICKEVGFVNMQDHVFEVPAGGWPKDPKKKLIGRFYGITMYEGAPGMSLRLLTHFRNWQIDEVHVLNAKFREDMKKTHYYHKYHVIFAQKPHDAVASRIDP